jgi:hypothetical protein
LAEALSSAERRRERLNTLKLERNERGLAARTMPALWGIDVLVLGCERAGTGA